MTAPIGVAAVSHRAQTAITASTRSGSATQSIRSWDSETMISNGSIPASRRGIRAMSMSTPSSPLLAISAAAEVSPAAPRSWRATRSPRSRSSSEHSISFFSANGSPTWTLGRLAASSSPSSALARTDAPPIPSRPVEAPKRISTLPGPWAAARISRSEPIRPMAIALTRQFCAYGPSK